MQSQRVPSDWDAFDRDLNARNGILEVHLAKEHDVTSAIHTEATRDESDAFARTISSG